MCVYTIKSYAIKLLTGFIDRCVKRFLQNLARATISFARYIRHRFKPPWKHMSVESELECARRLGEQLEELVVRKGQWTGEDRNILLMGLWATLFDYYKGILALLSNEFYGSAFDLSVPSSKP